MATGLQRWGCGLIFSISVGSAWADLQPGLWSGSYDCGQGTTPATLTVRTVTPVGARLRIDAAFHFGGGPLPRGSYLMQGAYDPSSRELSLTPTSWVSRPGNYVAVPFMGSVSADLTSFEGRVDFRNCGGIRLRSQTPPGTTATITPSVPLSGAASATPALPGDGAQAPQGRPAPEPNKPPASSAGSGAGSGGRRFASLFSPAYEFGAVPALPGCTVGLLTQEKRACIINPGSPVFSDRPYLINRNGPNRVANAEQSFSGLTILGKSGMAFKKGELFREEMRFTLKDGALTAIEVMQSPGRTDIELLVRLLSLSFTPGPITTREMLDPRAPLASSPAEIAKMTVKTYRWAAADADIQLECWNYCTLKAVGRTGKE